MSGSRSAPQRRCDGQGNPGLALEMGHHADMVVLDPARRDILALVGGYVCQKNESAISLVDIRGRLPSETPIQY
jgi:hypothetical protein